MTEARLILRQSYSLAKANLQMRYERNYLGILWFLLEPLFYFLIFIIIRKSLSLNIANYPLFLIIGIIVYNFFSHMTMQSVTCISQNKDLLKNIKLSPFAFVLAVCLQTLFFHIFEFIVIIIFLLYFKVSLFGLIAIYPSILVLLTVFSLGVSFFVAAVGVYIQDLVSVWRVLMWALFYSVPIFYAANNVLSPLIPLTYFVEITRSVILGGVIPSLIQICVLVVLSLGAFAVGFAVFNRLKRKFTELQ